MQETATIILAFSGIFTFAFGMAWLFPLVAAHSKHPKPPTRSDWLFGGMDLVLCLMDCIPVFWLIRAIPEAPSAYAEARRKWREEKSIRLCFYLFIISAATTVLTAWWMFP